MNSVDRVKELCFSNGYISQLRKGSFPASRLMQIADYFHVPVNYLLFGSECMDTNDENHNDNARLDGRRAAVYAAGTGTSRAGA